MDLSYADGVSTGLHTTHGISPGLSAPSVPLSGVRHQGSIWLNGLQSNLIASSCSRTGLPFMDTNYAFHWTFFLPDHNGYRGSRCSAQSTLEFQHRQYMLYQLVFLRIL